MCTDGFDDVFAAIDDIKDAIGQACLFQDLSHSLAGKRHHFGRLHYHCVAEHESIRHRPIRYHQWKIEWNDRSNNADRKMFRPALDTTADFEDLTRNKLRHRACKFGQLDALVNLDRKSVV